MTKAFDIGSYIKPVVAINLTSASSGPITGSFITKGSAHSCVFILLTGKDTGAPTARTLYGNLQTSLDSVSGWVDIADASHSLSLLSNSAEKNISLNGALDYIRSLASVSFTGGTNPTLQVGAEIVLGGFRNYPI